MKALLIVILIGAAFGAGYVLRGRGQQQASKPDERKILYWYDPMHPSYKSDKAGIAPDCGMQLVPKYADGDQPAAAPASTKTPKFYRDPQQPSYTSDRPGLNPETGNDLVPVYEDEAPGTIQVAADKQRLIGVQTSLVEVTTEGRTIRSAGKVVQDETRVTHVHTRTEGWIDKVLVDYTGKLVKQGDPLVTIYSPELLATQQEYLLALKAKDALAHSPFENSHDHSVSLIEAARRRLELWNLSEEQIQEVVRTQKPVRHITVFSPASGHILTRNAFPNQQVKPETELYTLVDLSHVWVMAEVFESDIATIASGTHARLQLPSMPGRTLRGRVSFVVPQVDAETRTLKVRIEAANPNLLLKPEMFVDVEFQVAPAPRITIPVDAVLDSGEKKTVFIDRGAGAFEPRLVQTGERFGNRIVILAGLKVGERIVTSGNFLLDSESRLKSEQHD
jgi:Cu(I)/Ag(I) efflux system membrane fusion protein